MGRILAIDYGRKRSGIAVTDTLQIIANGLTTVQTSQLMAFLSEYIAKEPVERVIIGLPKQMNNEYSENMANIQPFVNKFIKQYPDIPVEYVDERFTSVLAHKAMIDGGLKSHGNNGNKGRNGRKGTGAQRLSDRAGAGKGERGGDRKG